MELKILALEGICKHWDTTEPPNRLHQEPDPLGANLTKRNITERLKTYSPHIRHNIMVPQSKQASSNLRDLETLQGSRKRRKWPYLFWPLKADSAQRGPHATVQAAAQ